jgi:hypothetical protein
MFNDGVINMGRVLVLFAFTSQMGQQFPTNAWLISKVNNNNDVSDWSISFVTSYLIGQSFCVSIGQLFMKWSFLIRDRIQILQSIAHPPIRIEEKEPIRKLHFINN